MYDTKSFEVCHVERQNAVTCLDCAVLLEPSTGPTTLVIL